jgi:hypothetical protein
MKHRSQSPGALQAQGGWLLCSDDAVGKWLNPTLLQRGAARLRRFESDQRLLKGWAYATATMKTPTELYNH